jgi:hypothetical protein
VLSYAEIPGVWLLADTGEAIVTDHVDATVADAGNCWQLLLHNPTRFDADIKLLCETRAAFALPWEQCVTDGCQIVHVAAGGSAAVCVKKAASPQPDAGYAYDVNLQYNPQ